MSHQRFNVNERESLLTLDQSERMQKHLINQARISAAKHFGKFTVKSAAGITLASAVSFAVFTAGNLSSLPVYAPLSRAWSSGLAAGLTVPLALHTCSIFGASTNLKNFIENIKIARFIKKPHLLDAKLEKSRKSSKKQLKLLSYKKTIDDMKMDYMDKEGYPQTALHTMPKKPQINPNQALHSPSQTREILNNAPNKHDTKNRGKNPKSHKHNLPLSS